MTLWRVEMDEIEFKETYNTATDAISRVSDPATKTALALLGQLLWALNERIIEMQEYTPDEC